MLCGCGREIDLKITPNGYILNNEGLMTEAPETETQTETQSPSTVKEKTPDTVYWTTNGKVYHYDGNCTSLAKSKAVESGSILEAMNSGKERACKICGSK